MPKKIFHLFANDVNLGDLASADGIKFFLKKINKDIIFKDKFLAYSDLDEADVSEINNNCDLVVIGGGGLFWPHSKELLLRLSEKTIKQIKKPIVLYSLGLNYEKINSDLDEKLKNKIEVLSKYISFFSVRDMSTKDYLEKIGIKSDLVPCPSFCVKPGANFFLKRNDKKNIGFVSIPISRLNDCVAKEYIKTLSDFINIIKKDYNCYLIPHCSVVIESYSLLCDNTDIPIIYSLVPSQLMSAYNQMDYVFGSRGHSAMFAFGAEKPYVSISYNMKCKAFSDTLEYPDFLSINIKDITVQNLLNRLEKITKDKENIKKLFNKKKKSFFNMNMEYAKKICNLINVQKS